MAELTRGQKAAATRARNKAAKAATAARVVDVTDRELAGVQNGTGSIIPVSVVNEFLWSLARIEETTYGNVTGAVVEVQIAGGSLSAVYDGKEWHLQF